MKNAKNASFIRPSAGCGAGALSEQANNVHKLHRHHATQEFTYINNQHKTLS